MAFQYTFRADDISTWDVDTRDLVENRDRELELYASTIDNSFLNLNADNLTSGTVPSSRVTGSYTGITQVGTLTAGIASYSIGDTGPAGGKVFITPSTSGNTTGLYFEVAPVSAQVERTWSQFSPIFYQSTSVPLAQFDTIGTGKSNTVAIVNQGNNDPATCAAKYCDDYTYGGFSDWFLPSRNELAQIYTNRVAVGNDFGLGYFWSSSEEVYDGAWVRYFNGGADTNLAKANSLYVRPVRSFSTIGLNVRGSAVIRTAATQDGVILAGRAGGTSDYAVSILPTTLTASRTFTLPNVDGTAITTGNLSDITSVGTLASGSIPATLLTGTIASARLSGSYTGITQLGTISPSLTVTGGTGTTITAIANALITGSDNNSAIYLGGNTGSNATGGIEASWRGAGNPTIAVGVTRDNNGTKTLWEYTNRIDSYAGGTLRTRVDSSGLTVTAGSLYMSGSTNTALTFANTPDTALPWMQGPVLQGQTGWAFYSVVNGSYRMGYRNTSNGVSNYAWVNDSTMFGTSPDDSRNQAIINIVGGTAWFNAMGAGTGQTVQNYFGFLVYVSSRRELKENIVAVSSADGLDRILALRPVEFTMKPEYVLKANEYTPFDVKRGFIAQETAEVDHIYGQWGWVDENQMMATDPAIKGELPLEEATPIYWNHDAIIADLVASIQNINARLQQLETA